MPKNSPLSDAERSLRFTVDSLPQLAWIARPDGYREYFNQQWYDFTGTAPSESEGEAWGNLVYPADKERVIKQWQHSVATGEKYEVEYRLYHAPSESYRWVIGRALAYRDNAGIITNWYGTSTDIDEQKRASQIQTFLSNASKELASSLDYKTTLKKVTELCVPAVADWCSVDLYDEKTGFNQVSIAHVDPKKVSVAKEYRKHNPIHIDDPGGIPLLIRTGEAQYYSRITPELIKERLEDKKALKFMLSLNLHSIIIAPIRINQKVVGGISFVSSDSGRYYTETDLEMAEELAARISLAITNSRLYHDSVQALKERTLLEQELRLEKQNLESRVKERTEQLQLTNGGLRDEIVKRQAVEKELQEYGQNLARSNQELEDFAYVASHDLQEPLRKIQAFGDLLQTEYAAQLGTEGADYLRRMHSAAARMSTLIDDLLSFSRVTTKQSPRLRVNLNDILEEVKSDLETRIQQTEGTITADTMPYVTADPTHMRQLFQNLIANALKFSRPTAAPVIAVAAREDKDCVEIRISDNGIGFDEKYLDKIFSVFQRLHERDTYEGTGIGLAVCRKIVERYNGTITAESKKNKGSTFIIRLPQSHKGA